MCNIQILCRMISKCVPNAEARGYEANGHYMQSIWFEQHIAQSATYFNARQKSMQYVTKISIQAIYHLIPVKNIPNPLWVSGSHRHFPTPYPKLTFPTRKCKCTIQRWRFHFDQAEIFVSTRWSYPHKGTSQVVSLQMITLWRDWNFAANFATNFTMGMLKLCT